MQIRKAVSEDLPRLKKLWQDNFEDGTVGFCDFVFSTICDTDNIYLVEEQGKIVSMLIAAAELIYKQNNGFYLYSACTQQEYRKKGYMSELVKFAVEDQKKSYNKIFCLLQPATNSLFDYYAKLGFTTKTYLRRCEIDIKKNIWRNADFDIITAGRLPDLRRKFCGENTVHYNKSSCELYMKYLYTFGGSTAENDEGYAIYYVENDKIIVKELMSETNISAMKLLQAIRERTGCEKAQVDLDAHSNLFLGEGKIIQHCCILGIDGDIYSNLMFE